MGRSEDALARLSRDIEQEGQPTLAWCMEYARNGDLMAAYARAWAECRDPDTMLRALGRSLDAPTAARLIAALGRSMLPLLSRSAAQLVAAIDAAERAASGKRAEVPALAPANTLATEDDPALVSCARVVAQCAEAVARAAERGGATQAELAYYTSNAAFYAAEASARAQARALPPELSFDLRAARDAALAHMADAMRDIITPEDFAARLGPP